MTQNHENGGERIPMKFIVFLKYKCLIMQMSVLKESACRPEQASATG